MFDDNLTVLARVKDSIEISVRSALSNINYSTKILDNFAEYENQEEFLLEIKSALNQAKKSLTDICKSKKNDERT